MNRLSLTAALAAAALGVACIDTTGVPDLNNVTTAAIAGGLTRASVASLVNGVLNTNRTNLSPRSIIFAETMARDAYNLDIADSRWVVEPLQTQIDPSGYIGGYTSTWGQDYTAIRTANVVLDNLGAAQGLSAAERSATSGLLRTMKAAEFYRLLEMRDSLGIPVDVDRPTNAPLADFVCKPNVLAFISSLLDSAYADLQAGGAAFPFALPGGFSLRGNFTTPASFAAYNRALKGKVELYRGLDHQRPDAAAFDRAIAALNASFLSLTPSDTGRGVYYTYSTAAGDTTNPLVATTLHFNPSVGDSIQPGDARAYKIVRRSAPASLNGLSTIYDPAMSQPTAENIIRPLALMKDEELVLLRAQAEIEKGDLVSATNDINWVRVNAGGLKPYATFTSQDAARSAVLYEKRYSLLLEGPQRLVDLRAYRRLNATYLKREYPQDPFTSVLPIPQAEVDARGGTITMTCR